MTGRHKAWDLAEEQTSNNSGKYRLEDPSLIFGYEVSYLVTTMGNLSATGELVFAEMYCLYSFVDHSLCQNVPAKTLKNLHATQ